MNPSMIIDDCKVIYRGPGTSGIIVAENTHRRDLYLEGDTLQSCMLLSDPNELYLEYSQAMMCALLFQQKPQEVLLIGLGGGSLVKFLLEFLPEARIDVAEVNPEVIQVARKYFMVPESEQLRIMPVPGEDVVAERSVMGRNYDIIFIDAFDDQGPARALLEEDFIMSCRELLSKGGVFAMNLWNRPVDNFPEHLDIISMHFNQQVYTLRLAGANRNAIVFGFSKQLQPEKLMELKPASRKLSQQTGINFMRWLRQIYWQNI